MHILTIDNNLSFQQNFANYPLQVGVIVARDNTYTTIMGFIDDIVLVLKEDFIGPKAIVHPGF